MPFNKATSHVHEWIVFVYLRRLPEDERRGNRSIPVCRFDVVCRIKPAHTPSSNTSCCFTDFSVEVNYRSALKRQHGGRMHEGERSDYWVWKDTHTYREREKAQVNVWNQADKAAFLFVISLLCTPPARPIYPVPLLLPNLFFHKCLLITFSFLVLSFSLSLSLCLSISFPPSHCVFLCQFPVCIATAGLLSHISAQLPSVLRDRRTSVPTRVNATWPKVCGRS